MTFTLPRSAQPGLNLIIAGREQSDQLRQGHVRHPSARRCSEQRQRGADQTQFGVELTGRRREASFACGNSRSEELRATAVEM